MPRSRPRASSTDAFMFDAGAARRSVAELAPSVGRSRWVSSLPGGTSGQLGDPGYVNLLPDWLTNDSIRSFSIGATAYRPSFRSRLAPAA